MKHGERLVGLPAKRQAVVNASKHRLCLQAIDWFTDKAVGEDQKHTVTGQLFPREMKVYQT
jgi:hypothetical protein